MTAVAKFFRRSSSDRVLFFEALAALVAAKVRVHTIPFRRLAPTLGRSQAETSPAISAPDRTVAVKVSWAVQTAARYIPLGFVCLPQAIAAQRMLRRRGIASTLYLGVAPDREKKESIIAHAWVRAGDKVLTGQAESLRHTVIAKFADDAPSA